MTQKKPKKTSNTSKPSSQVEKKRKPDLEDTINSFLVTWDCQKNTELLSLLQEFFELYDVDEQDDWVEKSVGSDDLQNVRLIRTVYLISKLAHLYASPLCTLKYRFPNMWKTMEEHI